MILASNLHTKFRSILTLRVTSSFPTSSFRLVQVFLCHIKSWRMFLLLLFFTLRRTKLNISWTTVTRGPHKHPPLTVQGIPYCSIFYSHLPCCVAAVVFQSLLVSAYQFPFGPISISFLSTHYSIMYGSLADNRTIFFSLLKCEITQSFFYNLHFSKKHLLSSAINRYRELK